VNAVLEGAVTRAEEELCGASPLPILAQCVSSKDSQVTRTQQVLDLTKERTQELFVKQRSFTK
jgi:hypothetical protein